MEERLLGRLDDKKALNAIALQWLDDLYKANGLKGIDRISGKDLKKALKDMGYTGDVSKISEKGEVYHRTTGKSKSTNPWAYTSGIKPSGVMGVQSSSDEEVRAAKDSIGKFNKENSTILQGDEVKKEGDGDRKKKWYEKYGPGVIDGLSKTAELGSVWGKLKAKPERFSADIPAWNAGHFFLDPTSALNRSASSATSAQAAFDRTSNSPSARAAYSQLNAHHRSLRDSEILSDYHSKRQDFNNRETERYGQYLQNVSAIRNQEAEINARNRAAANSIRQQGWQDLANWFQRNRAEYNQRAMDNRRLDIAELAAKQGMTKEDQQKLTGRKRGGYIFQGGGQIPTITGSQTGSNKIAELERGEVAIRPDGEAFKVGGKKHSQGGEKFSQNATPPGTRVFSDYLKLPGSKGVSYADAAGSVLNRLKRANNGMIQHTLSNELNNLFQQQEFSRGGTTGRYKKGGSVESNDPVYDGGIPYNTGYQVTSPYTQGEALKRKHEREAKEQAEMVNKHNQANPTYRAMKENDRTVTDLMGELSGAYGSARALGISSDESKKSNWDYLDLASVIPGFAVLSTGAKMAKYRAGVKGAIGVLNKGASKIDEIKDATKSLQDLPEITKRNRVGVLPWFKSNRTGMVARDAIKYSGEAATAAENWVKDLQKSYDEAKAAYDGIKKGTKKTVKDALKSKLDDATKGLDKAKAVLDLNTELANSAKKLKANKAIYGKNFKIKPVYKGLAIPGATTGGYFGLTSPEDRELHKAKLLELLGLD